MTLQSIGALWLVAALSAAALAGEPGQPSPSPGDRPELAALREDLRARGAAACDQGKWAEALAIHERLTVVDPDYGFGWMGLGWSRQYSGDPRRAVEAYEKVLALGGMPAGRILVHMAECWTDAGDNQGALRDLARAVDAGFPRLDLLKTNRHFNAIRADSVMGPRFRDLINDIDVSGMSRAQGWREDFRIIRKEARRLLYNASVVLPAIGFDAALDQLDRSADSAGDEALEIGVMKLFRAMGDGHTQALPAEDRVVPVLWFKFVDGWFITGAREAQSDLIWSQVLAIEGRAPDDVLAMVEPLTSRDNLIRVQAQGAGLMRQPRVLHGLGVTASDHALRLRVRDHAGVEREVTLESVKPFTAVVRVPPGGGELPIHIRRRDELYWFQRLAGAPAIYLQYNGCGEMDDRPLGPFCDELGRALDEPDTRALIVDLRWNGGGNMFASTPLVDLILAHPKLRRGRALFVIAGRQTFSAAMLFAVQMERYAHAIFVGEPTGSSPNFVGETNSFSLPYSRMRASISNLRWQPSTADDNRQWIAPQIRTPMSFAMWKQGRDESAEAILTVLDTPASQATGESPTDQAGSALPR